MGLNKKYEPLKTYLMNCNNDTVELSYKEMEEIIDGFLPGSASNYMEWWENGDHTQAKAWIGAGWKVTKIKLGESIVFTRDFPSYLEDEESISRETIEEFLNSMDEPEVKVKKKLGINIHFVLSGVVLLMFLLAAVAVGKGSMTISQIKSVHGNSLEQAYYSGLGDIYMGYSIIVAALGIFFSSVLVWIGKKKD